MIANRTFVVAGVVLAVALAAFVSPFASSSPDGLERVAKDHGIQEPGQSTWAHAAIPDYKMPGIEHEGVATGVAGVIGTIGVLAAGLLIGRLLTRKRTSTP